MGAGDEVDSAIQYAGITHEPSNLNSNQPSHSNSIPTSASTAELPNNSSSTNDDDETHEQPDATFSPSASPKIGNPITSPTSTSNRLSLLPELRSPSKSLTSRASIESLSFGYRDHLLPLSLSGADDDDDEVSFEAGNYGELEGNAAATGLGSNRSRRRRNRSNNRAVERRVGLVDGIALTVGLQIGSGIFSSPGVVTLNAGSVGASLIVWIVSGVLAWTGASSFAELGAAIPLNGGAQAYLNYSFGPLSAYLFAWTAIVALKPGSGAIIATIFGEYLARVLFHATSSSADSSPHEQGLDGIPDWSIKLIACLITVLVCLLNAISAKLGTRTQIATTVMKLMALVAVPILAIIQAARGKVPDTSKHAFSSLSSLFEGSSSSPSAYALALYSGLWSFDGWDQSSYVAGEMKNVNRDLPRVIHSSLFIVLIVFLATVTSYFVVLPASLVSRTNTVALDFGSATLGTAGGIVFASLVAFSCFGALNGQFYTTARLVLAAGKEGYLPSMFGRTNSRTNTPLSAIVLQGILVLLFVLFGSGFASLVNFYGVCAWLFYFATVLGLLVLRIKEPNLERPYKTWLVTPLLFSTVALFLLFMPIFSAPLEALAALGFVLAGVPAYYITQTGLPFLQRWRGSGGVRAERNDRLRDELEEERDEEVEMLMRKSEDAGESRGRSKDRIRDSEEEEEFKIGDEDEEDEEVEGSKFRGT